LAIAKAQQQQQQQERLTIGLRKLDFARPDSYLFIRGHLPQPSPYQIANVI
jgi:hypothetical protein